MSSVPSLNMSLNYIKTTSFQGQESVTIYMMFSFYRVVLEKNASKIISPNVLYLAMCSKMEKAMVKHNKSMIHIFSNIL